MPQSHYKIGSVLGQTLSGLTNDYYYNKGQNDGALMQLRQKDIALRDEQTRKAKLEADSLQRFSDPVFRSELVAGALGLDDADTNRLKTHDTGGGWGSGTFKMADPDFERFNAPKQPVMLSSPEALANPQQDSIGEMLKSFAPKQKDVVLPNAAPKWAQIAGQLGAMLRGGDADKVLTPQTVAALRAQAEADAAIKSGDVTAVNILNTLANPGSTYTPYKSDTHGRTTNEGSGVVNVTDAPLHAAKLEEVIANTLQSNASAANSNASAAKTKSEMDNNPKTKKSDEYKAVRDDIRADYNAEYPIDRFTGLRPKGALSYDDYTSSWLNKHGIDQRIFFNTGNQVVPAATNGNVDQKPFAPPAHRFANDPTMKGNKAGKMVEGKGIEVLNASGKLIGYYK